MKFQVLARARLLLGLAAASFSLSGCVNVRYDEQHADLNSRMYMVSLRFSRMFSQQGMVGVIADVEDCYRDSSLVLVKRFALQDCLSYDYAAYTLDKEMARTAYRRPRAQYFQDAVASPRMVKYGKLDGFNSPPELSAYLTATSDKILRDIRNSPGSFLWNPSRPRPPLVSGGGFF